MASLRCLSLVPVVVLGLACGPSKTAGGPPAKVVPTLSCPAPIGAVPQEDCAAIAADFGALSVDGAIPLASADKHAEQRVAAIRAVGAVARSIKDQRVKLCERYVKCAVPLSEHDAQDQLLAGAMRSLADLWNKRRLSSMDEVTRFREAVRAIDRRVNGGAESAPPPPSAPRAFRAEDALARVEDPGVAFRADAGAVTVTATAEGKRDALISKPDVLSLPAGHRYRITLSGSYRPATPPLIRPGDEIEVRLSYRAEGDADLKVALRSIEDPDAEVAETWKAAPGERGSKDLRLTADPQQTGFYLATSIKGAPVEIADLQILRAGNLILAAQPGEPGVKTDCTASSKRPARPGRLLPKGHDPSGAKAVPMTCAPGAGDRITIGQPEGYLVLGLRDSAGMRASQRALSLDGGRSLDATLGEDARLVITLVGAGSATVDRVEVTDLGL